MDATITQFKKLVLQLSKDYPKIKFIKGNEYKWSPRLHAITYNPSNPQSIQLLHELSHAILEHNDYNFDIELIKMETEAWEHVKTSLSSKYNLTIDENSLQNYIDSYRQWLHSRSICPNCNNTGIQTKKNTYSCINCRCSWSVNDAKFSGIRKTKINLLLSSLLS